MGVRQNADGAYPSENISQGDILLCHDDSGLWGGAGSFLVCAEKVNPSYIVHFINDPYVLVPCLWLEE